MSSEVDLSPAAWRKARASAARKLRNQGLSMRAIGDRLNVSVATVHADLGTSAEQLDRAALESMTDAETNEARRSGRLDALMGRAVDEEAPDAA